MGGFLPPKRLFSEVEGDGTRRNTTEVGLDEPCSFLFDNE